ncbi:hypothetical protein C0J52_27380, partial [Blattella germanica]
NFGGDQQVLHSLNTSPDFEEQLRLGEKLPAAFLDLQLQIRAAIIAFIDKIIQLLVQLDDRTQAEMPGTYLTTLSHNCIEDPLQGALGLQIIQTSYIRFMQAFYFNLNLEYLKAASVDSWEKLRVNYTSTPTQSCCRASEKPTVNELSDDDLSDDDSDGPLCILSILIQLLDSITTNQ